MSSAWIRRGRYKVDLHRLRDLYISTCTILVTGNSTVVAYESPASDIDAPTVFHELNCVGNENTLFDCPNIHSFFCFVVGAGVTCPVSNSSKSVAHY